MKNQDYKTYVYLAALLMLIFIIIAVYSKNQEHYTNTDAISLSVINETKAILYNTNGLYNFYSSGASNSSYYTNRETFKGFVEYILAFNPTLVDNYCLIANGGNNSGDDRCKNLYIDNIAYTDNTFGAITNTEQQCSSAITTISGSLENSMVRIMNNKYSLRKRCITLSKFTSTNMPQTGFKISVDQSVNLTHFVLSRPLFISFGNFGLYTILYNITNDSMFYHYNSQNTSGHNTFYIAPVKSYDNTNIFPSTTSNVSTLSYQTFPITIYYLNYTEPIHTSEYLSTEHSSMNCNIMTLIMSKPFLENSVGNDSTRISYSLSITTNTQPSNMFATTNMAISFDNHVQIPDQILNVIVQYNMSQTNLSITIPSEFLRALASLRSQNQEHNYHVCFTYSMDVVTIVCFLQVGTSSSVFVNRQPMQINTDVVEILYDLHTLESSLEKIPGNLKKEMDKYKEFATITSIPNYSFVAKYLGYNL